MNKTLITVIILIIIIASTFYFFFNKPASVSQQVAPTANTEVNTQSSATETSNASISIKNFAFAPQTLTIKAGTKVTWTNEDSAPHTVTSDADSTLNSPHLSTGQSFSFTFTNAGTYNYHCAVHPTMKGTIIVQ